MSEEERNNQVICCVFLRVFTHLLPLYRMLKWQVYVEYANNNESSIVGSCLDRVSHPTYKPDSRYFVKNVVLDVYTRDASRPQSSRWYYIRRMEVGTGKRRVEKEFIIRGTPISSHSCQWPRGSICASMFLQIELIIYQYRKALVAERFDNVMSSRLFPSQYLASPRECVSDSFRLLSTKLVRWRPSGMAVGDWHLVFSFFFSPSLAASLLRDWICLCVFFFFSPLFCYC